VCQKSTLQSLLIILPFINNLTMAANPPAYNQWPAHPLPRLLMLPIGVPPPGVPLVRQTRRLDELVCLPQIRAPMTRGNKVFRRGEEENVQSIRHDEAFYAQARGYVPPMACSNCTGVAGPRAGDNLPPTSGHGPFDCCVLVAGRAAGRNEGYIRNACANCFYYGITFINTCTFKLACKITNSQAMPFFPAQTNDACI